MREYRRFTWKDTNLRVACAAFDVVTTEIVQQRQLLEAYIERHPQFQTALVPLPLQPDAPPVVRLMAAAADKTGVGPMAAVAGTLAQLGAEKAMAAGCAEAIVENGGDLFVASNREVVVGIYAGENRVAASLAFQLQPADLPLAICSSSSYLGHSLSFGDCDLATVVAADGALADAAATLACNEIHCEADLESVLEKVGAIAGIRGILAVKNDRIGLWGSLPKLIRNTDPQTTGKITCDRRSPGPAA